MGGYEPSTPVEAEPSLEYHPRCAGVLTTARYPGVGQCQAGSLTGAVASQKITEAPKGPLSTVGNRVLSVMADGGLTARPTSRAGRKRGHSDPVAPCGRAIAHRIKGTPGITG